MKRKNNKGFTLVELVVVIAIIGVLAAILVPTLMHYVKKAKLKNANLNAKVLYNEMNVAIADIVDNTATTVNDCTSAVDCSVDDPNDLLRHTIYIVMKNNSSDQMGYAFWRTGLNTNEIRLMQWCSKANPGAGDFIGQYPDPINDVENLPGNFNWGQKMTG